MTASVSLPSMHGAVRAMLEETRERTLLLVATMSDEDLARQHDPLMGPIVWDLAHIAHFEELWLTRNLDGPIRFVEMPGLFNPMEHPRSERGELPLPRLEECVTLMAGIRKQVLARLRRVDLDRGPQLARAGFVYHLVIQHEVQHNETMLQTMQLKQGAPYRPPVRRPHPESSPPTDRGRMAVFPGGEVTLGTDDRSATYDNERPRHQRSLAPFAIDAYPVTNAEYADFIEADGYRRPELWSVSGQAWLAESGASAPAYWERRHGGWWSRVMDREGPVAPDHPVCHVCFHEAEAFARYAGKRLPAEAEWEVAATWDAAAGMARRFPWGDEPATPDLANVDQLAFGTAPVGAYAANVSPMGCYGMIGDVWEWTASNFVGYPGFEAYPYPEYSETSFGAEYQVLRGGSWATRPAAIRGTFRNWDYPIRRQIFSGFRCARDG
jgi:iron(II)-dependent oxidoreductase